MTTRPRLPRALTAAFAALVVGLALGPVGPAAALSIDFGSSDFAGASGRSSFSRSVGPIVVTVRTGSRSSLTWSPSGLGVDCSGLCMPGEDPSEVGPFERIFVGFSEVVPIDTVGISNLGRSERGMGIAIWSARRSFSGGAGDTTVDFGVDARELIFFSTSLGDFNVRSASIGIANPEPGAAALFGAGALLVGLALRRRA